MNQKIAIPVFVGYSIKFAAITGLLTSVSAMPVCIACFQQPLFPVRKQFTICCKQISCLSPYGTLPRVLSHKPHKLRSRKNKRRLRRSIEERPEKVNTLEEFGHWEADTVVGKKQGREAVIFTSVEKKSRKYIAIKIPSRTCTGVAVAMQKLKKYYG